MSHTLFKANFFFLHFLTLFQAFFSILPSTQTIKVIGLFFMSWPWKIGLWICVSTPHLFLKAFFQGGGERPPRLYIDSDPPSLYRVNSEYFLHCLWSRSETTLKRNHNRIFVKKMIDIMLLRVPLWIGYIKLSTLKCRFINSFLVTFSFNTFNNPLSLSTFKYIQSVPYHIGFSPSFITKIHV